MVVDKQELVRKLQVMKPIVPKNTPIEPAKGILVKNGKVHANNLNLAITSTLSIISDETFVIPAKAVEMIATLPNGELSITSNENHKITIKIGSIKHTFQGVDPEDFPEKETDISGEGIKVNGKDLKKALRFVTPAMGENFNRPEISGVRLDASGGALNIVTVDGYRLQWAILPNNGEIAVTIPKEAVSVLMKLDMFDEVEIKVSEKTVVIDVGEYIISASLCEGAFLDYNKAYEKGNQVYKLPRMALEQAVARASRCSSDMIKAPLEVSIKGNTAKIYICSHLGEYEENLPVVTDVKEEVRIGFNVKYLLDALKSHSGGELEWCMGGSTNPTTLEHEEYRSMVLPVRLKERG